MFTRKVNVQEMMKDGRYFIKDGKTCLLMANPILLDGPVPFGLTQVLVMGEGGKPDMKFALWCAINGAIVGEDPAVPNPKPLGPDTVLLDVEDVVPLFSGPKGIA